jgi:hypothetical protein
MHAVYHKTVAELKADFAKVSLISAGKYCTPRAKYAIMISVKTEGNKKRNRS